MMAGIGAISMGRFDGIKIKLFGQIGPSPNTWGWTLSFRHTFYKEKIRVDIMFCFAENLRPI